MGIALCQDSCPLVWERKLLPKEGQMARYSAQVRNTILRKLLPPENRSARELAQEYGVTVATIYGWKAHLNRGTLRRDEG